MSDTYRHGHQAGIDRRWDLKRAALDAEWAGATGQYAGVIRQLRHRGAEATIRSKWIYRGLLVVILVGLAFYLGLPFWERYLDGTQETLENQQAAHQTEHLKLDHQLASLVAGTDTTQGLLQLLVDTATPLRTGVSENILGVVVDGDTILIYGNSLKLGDSDSARSIITRSTDRGANFSPVESGVRGFLNRSITDGDTILLYGVGLEGEGGIITRSIDGGASFTPVASGVSEGLIRSVVDGDRILLYGTGGVVVAVDSRWAEALQAVSATDGSETGPALSGFLDDELPPHLQALPSIANIRRSLSNLEARRDVLEILEADTQKQLSRLKDAPALLKREEARETFAGFLALCRGEDMAAELTMACLQGWQAQLAAERDNWWQALAVQVPPGVLLLFLLATLGVLYRYSLRMAGFYHSRADALELLQMGIDEQSQKTISALATDIAADKVEFGKGNTPTDQAVELAKAIAGRG